MGNWGADNESVTSKPPHPIPFCMGLLNGWGKCRCTSDFPWPSDPLGTAASLQASLSYLEYEDNRKMVQDLTHSSPSAMLSLLSCKTCMPRPGLELYTEHPLEVHQYMMQISLKDILLHHCQLPGTVIKLGEYSPALEHCWFKCSFNWIESSTLLGQIILQSHLLCSCCILLLLHGSISAVFGREASACHSITPSFGILPSGTHYICVRGYYECIFIQQQSMSDCFTMT